MLYDYALSLNTNNTFEYDNLENALRKLNSDTNFIVRKFLHV